VNTLTVVTFDHAASTTGYDSA